jgi:electron transport complex protein RnfG
MNPTLRNSLFAGGILIGFGLIGGGLVAFTHLTTRAQIAANERAALQAGLNALVPPDRYDNDLIADAVQMIAPELGGDEPVTVYRACKQGQPVALLASVVAPNGYSGPIRLLVGVYADGTLAGVRVLAHHETPGLGDPIEVERSDWILNFTGKSLGQPPPAAWAVKKDGGAFDQFAGATITPRAVVQAVRRFLVYFQQHRERLFTPVAEATRQ